MYSVATKAFTNKRNKTPKLKVKENRRSQAELKRKTDSIIDESLKETLVMFIELLEDIQGSILDYCGIEDVKKLSLTSKAYNKTLQDYLFHTVGIPESACLDRAHRSGLVERIGLFSRDEWSTAERFIERIRWKVTVVLRVNISPRCDENDRRVIFKAISKLEHLQELHIREVGRYVPVHDSYLQIVSEKLCNLRVLGLRDGTVTSTGCSFLSKLSKLETLDISWCDQVTDISFAAVCSLSRLKKLNIRRCSTITDHGLCSIQNLVHLESLDMANCNKITDVGFTAVGKLPLLKKLNISQCASISDHGLCGMQNLINLESLDMNSCDKITDFGFAAVCELPRLKKLDISWCSKITDHGLCGIRNLINLESLGIAGTKITDFGFASICELPRLKILSIRYCVNVTDHGLCGIKKLVNLGLLEITGCENISDNGLCSIKGLKIIKRN